MNRIVSLALGIALAVAATAACSRLERARPMDGRGPGDLPKEQLAFRDAVPAEFGDLIGVTAYADNPTWTQAWFVKPDKSIVVVWINSQTGYMLADALVIPRR